MANVGFSRRVALAIVCALYLAYTAWQVLDRVWLAYRGTPAVGEVTKIGSVPSRTHAWAPQWRVEYRFAARGHTFAGEVAARDAFIDNLPDRKVRIRHDPANPERHVVLPLDWPWDAFGLVVLMVVTAFLAVWANDARRR